MPHSTPLLSSCLRGFGRSLTKIIIEICHSRFFLVRDFLIYRDRVLFRSPAGLNNGAFFHDHISSAVAMTARSTRKTQYSRLS